MSEQPFLPRATSAGEVVTASLLAGDGPTRKRFVSDSWLSESGGGLQQRRGRLALKLEPPAAKPEPTCLELLAREGFALGGAIGGSVNGTFAVISATKGKAEHAVKHTSERSGDGSLGEMLSREFQVLRDLQHPHIVTASRVCRSSSGCALVMERCPGCPLARLFSFDGWLSLEHRLASMDHVLDALAFMHRRSVSHRDLHAANVVLDGSAKAGLVGLKIIDFGSARTAETWSDCALNFADEVSPSISPPSPVKRRGSLPAELCRLPFEASPALDVFAAALLLVGLLSGFEVASKDMFQDDGALRHFPVPPAMESQSGCSSTRELLEAMLDLDWRRRPCAEAARARLAPAAPKDDVQLSFCLDV